MDELLGQSFGDFELIVSDNASTDETGEIVRAVAATDSRIRYYRHERNIGALPNANFAFAQARGSHYALCAHDDGHAPDFLERLVEALASEPDAALAYGRKGLIDDEGRRLRFDLSTDRYTTQDGRTVSYDSALDQPLSNDPVERLRAILGSNDVNAPIHGLFRREVFARTGGFHLNGGDRLVLAQVALAHPFVFVDAELFHFRIHAESTVFLDRESRIARETGGHRVSMLDALRTLRAYLQAIDQSPLPRGQRREAYRAVLGDATLKRIAGNVFRPGADNYWGLRRWPWQSAPATA